MVNEDNIKAMLANTEQQLTLQAQHLEGLHADLAKIENARSQFLSEREATYTRINQIQAAVSAFRLALGMPAVQNALPFDPAPRNTESKAFPDANANDQKRPSEPGSTGE